MTDELIISEQNQSFIAPVVDIQEALARYNSFKEFVSKVLEKGRDYGEIPGTSKPTLLKPGAEKLGAFFGLRPIFALQDSVNDWTGKDHNGEPFFFREYKCQLFRNGELVGEGVGSCNSWEKKYRYRWVDKSEVPENLDKSALQYKDAGVSEFAFAVDKAETTGKYGKPAEYWRNFTDAIANGTARSITRKTSSGKTLDAWEIGGRLYAVPNRDVADQVNTIDKMAQKRALVAAILIATNASDYFTQDMEDFSDGGVDIIEAEFTEPVPQSKPLEKPKSDNGKFSRPMTAESLKEAIAKKAASYEGNTASKQQRALMVGMLDTCFVGDELKRHQACFYLTGHESSKDIPDNFVLALLDWLKPEKDSGGAYIPDGIADREAQAVVTQMLKDMGQQELKIA